MPRKYLVTAFWDETAGVWVATSDDIPGLVTEAATLDVLEQRVTDVAPELMRDNGLAWSDSSSIDIVVAA